MVVVCYSTSSGGPSSSTYDMVVTFEVSKLNAWSKLGQSKNIPLEGVGRRHARRSHARRQVGVKHEKRRGTVFVCGMRQCGGGGVLLY